MRSRILAIIIIMVLLIPLSSAIVTPNHVTSITLAKDVDQRIVCPRRGGTLVVIHFGDPKSFNPDARADDPLYPVASQIFNKLVTLDVDYNVIPDLAESWEVTPNASVFIFHLRKGVKWHDGVPFTCKDVKYTFEAMKKYKGVAYGLLRLDKLERVECWDDYTAVFRFSEPNAPFISFVAWYGTFILPEHIYNKSEYRDWMDPKIPALKKPIGTGPFKFVEYVKGSHIVLEANPDYFKGRPCIDKIIFKIVPDPVSALQTFLAGEGDVLLTEPPLTEIPKLNKTKGVIVVARPMPSRWFLAFNMVRGITLNRDFRFAIAYAINRTDILVRAFNGFGFVAKGMYVPAIKWAYNPNAQPPEYNPKKAEEILDKLGFKRGPDGFRRYPNGTKIVLRLVTFQYGATESMAQIIKEHLRKIGIDVKIELLELGTFQEKTYKEKDFDISITDGFWGPDPHNMYLRFSKGGHNLPGYSNPEFDKLTEEAAKTSDIKKRKELYWKAQEILAKDLPFLPLIDVIAFYIAKTDWSGFYWELPKKVGSGVYETVWWKKGTPVKTAETTTTETAATTTPPSTPTAPPTTTTTYVITAIVVAVIVIVIAIIALRRR